MQYPFDWIMLAEYPLWLQCIWIEFSSKKENDKNDFQKNTFYHPQETYFK